MGSTTIVALVKHMIAGMIAWSVGCCPRCGLDVKRTLARNALSLRDVYDCEACGAFEYGTAIAGVPVRRFGRMAPSA